MMIPPSRPRTPRGRPNMRIKTARAKFIGLTLSGKTYEAEGVAAPASFWPPITFRNRPQRSLGQLGRKVPDERCLTKWSVSMATETLERGRIGVLDPREQHFRIRSPRAGLSLFLRYLPSAREVSREDRVALYVHGGTFPSGLSIAHRFDGRSWRDELCDAGFHVWALDFHGFGRL